MSGFCLYFVSDGYGYKMFFLSTFMIKITYYESGRIIIDLILKIINLYSCDKLVYLPKFHTGEK